MHCPSRAITWTHQQAPAAPWSRGVVHTWASIHAAQYWGGSVQALFEASQVVAPHSAPPPLSLQSSSCYKLRNRLASSPRMVPPACPALPRSSILRGSLSSRVRSDRLTYLPGGDWYSKRIVGPIFQPLLPLGRPLLGPPTRPLLPLPRVHSPASK